MDENGLLLSRLQAMVFEASQEASACNSFMFIRRFMFSSFTLEEFDTGHILFDNETEYSIIKNIEAEYKESSYGKEKYSKNELYWIGYMYRYMAYTNELTSRQCFRIIKPNELRGLYNMYHTLDCSNAIDRILEDKGYDFTPEGLNKRALDIYRRIFEERNK